MSESQSYLVTIHAINDLKWTSSAYAKLRAKLLPDLYVEVHVDQALVAPTTVVKRSLSPIWGETLTIPSARASSKLTFKLKHKSSLLRDPCFGMVNETLERLLRLSEGQNILQLKLEEGPKNSISNAQGLLSVRIEAASNAQARENNTRAAGKALDRLRSNNNGADRDAIHFAHGALGQHTLIESSAAGEITKGASLDNIVDSALVLGIGSKLDTLAGNISQNADILVNLGTVLGKIQRIADVTVQAMDTLAKAYKQQKETDAAAVNLFEQMKDLYSFVGDVESLPGKIRQLGRTVIRILEQTTECGIFFREYTDRGFAARLIEQVVINRNKTISDLSSTLSQLRSDLQSGLQLHTAFVSSQTRDGVDRLVKSDSLKTLAPAKMNAANRPMCLPGTRQDLLKTILEWLTTPSEENILWLHGAAGLGKSTLATTIAEYFRGLHRRGAFLFFDRNSPIESDPSRVISTLAYQLAKHNDDVGAAISDAIKGDSALASAPLASQFISLLSEPLSAASAQISGPVIIVLDALDECGDASSRRTLLNILKSPEFAKLPRQFRFLITSRPDHDIQVVLSSIGHTHPIDLDLASDKDMMFYLEHEIKAMYADRHVVDDIPVHWPGEKALQTLVAYAAGLFIWAATAIKLLIHADDPIDFLQSILSEEREVFTLHELYKTALVSACQWQPGATTELYRRLLGMIIISQVPLTVETMADLLETRDSGRGCRNALHRLGSVIKWSPGEPPHTVHKSFPDYLTDRSACGSEPWFIDIEEHQYALTLECLRIMNSQLRFNMCNLQTSHIPNVEMTDLPARINDNIPQRLSYPCLFWGHHLRHISSGQPSVLSLISQFFESKLLCWLEVLSLVGEVFVASQTMLVVKDFVPNENTRMQAFAQDTLKLVRVFAPAITHSTPHIYISCLPLAPPLSVIKQHYMRNLEHSLLISGNVEYGWAALQQVYAGHTDRVTSAAFSPDGRHVASGSWDSIHIWDAETVFLATEPIRGHTSNVTSVSISPDGRRIVSGSWDHTVCIWDADTGVLAAGPFERHAFSVLSVAFSPDGRRVASGSADCTIRIRDAETGALTASPFEGHSDQVNSVVFSPDGKKVASGAHDKTLRIWNPETSTLIAGPFTGHKGAVLSVVFSPDGQCVASGSEDRSVCIWDVHAGTLIAGPFEGHLGHVSSVAYSPDGRRVASGSEDQSIRIWDLQSGSVAGIFKGHAGDISSVAFSSDGQRIASASWDGTVRIWDAEPGPLDTGVPFKGHNQDISSIAFSPDGRQIVSGSYDSTVCLWDAEMGDLTGGPLREHTSTGIVFSVAFSPNGRQIVSGSADGNVRLWDVETGSHISFTGSTGYFSVRSVAFSPDGRKVASGSSDENLRIWDVEMGTLIAGPFGGHTGMVFSVAFSPDGRQVASGSDDSIRIRDAETGVPTAGPFEGNSPVLSVAFSPDGRKIVSGLHDNTIRIWDIETGTHTAIVGHTNHVSSTGFSPDGRHIVSGSEDGTVCIWDAKTGALVLGPFVIGQKNLVYSVAFSPDGQRLAATGTSAIRIIDVSALHALHRQGDNLSLPSRELRQNEVGAPEGFTKSSRLRENGWMVNRAGDLLFYVPPDMRAGLWWPDDTAVIFTASTRATKLDTSRFLHGNYWAQCYIEAPDRRHRG
ncbi:hypothetical protein HWV62_13201 [Athelia sp. TMB]|nr:hypothetical protein HWV62_13201 [Athelia sp. TMB]